MTRLATVALAMLMSTVASGREPIFAKVLSCYDGDTCTLEREILSGRDRVRLSNADTPEIEGKRQAEIDRAIEARATTPAQWSSAAS